VTEKALESERLCATEPAGTARAAESFLGALYFLSSKQADRERERLRALGYTFSLTTSAAFVAGAAVTGVLGNASYDFLKAALRLWWRKLDTSDLAGVDYEAAVQELREEELVPMLDFVARTTTIEYCRRHGLEPPDFDTLIVGTWSIREGGDFLFHHAEVRSTASRLFYATVNVPMTKDIEEFGVEVGLSRSSLRWTEVPVSR
jgi:hypothetical protein